MGDVVNLRLVRKRARRERSSAEAAEQRLQHGESGTDRALRAANKEKAQRELDGNRIDQGDGQ